MATVRNSIGVKIELCQQSEKSEKPEKRERGREREEREREKEKREREREREREKERERERERKRQRPEKIVYSLPAIISLRDFPLIFEINMNEYIFPR